MSVIQLKRWSASATEKAWSIYIKLPRRFVLVFCLAKHRSTEVSDGDNDA